MKRNTAWALLVIILFAAFFLRQYRLLDFPYHGDEVDEGDIALEILHGHLAPFYPQNEGNEPLYQFSLAPFFAVLGDSVIANRWPSAAWSTVFVALMYVYGRVLFRSRRVGVMAAGLTAALWWPTVFGRLGLREITQPVMMTPALLGLVLALRAPSEQHALKAGLIGAIFAGLTSYTFLAGRGFPLVVILFLAYIALVQRDRLHKQWRAFLLYFVVMIALSVPLYAYLAIHPEYDYHVRDLSEHSWLAQGDVNGLVTGTLATLGMFTVRGDSNWVRNIAGRPVFVGSEGWLFYLGVGLCLWYWRRPEYALQLIVVATMLMPNILTEDPPRWTRSIGILPGLLVTTVLPLEWAWTRVKHWNIAGGRTSSSASSEPEANRSTGGSRTAPTPDDDARGNRRRLWINALYAVLVGTLGVSIYARTATDLFQVWMDNPGVYWMTLAFYDGAGKYINRSVDSTPLNYVMDYYTPWRKTNVQRVVQRKDVALRWSVNNAFVFPDDPRGWRVAFQSVGAPARPLLDTFLDLDAPVYIDPRVDPEGQHPLRVYSLPRARLEEHLSRARAGVVFLPGASTPIAVPIQVADAATLSGVDNVLSFLGYEVLNPNARPGSGLNVLTYWRVLQRPPNMAVFLHLLNPEQKVVTQFDGFAVVVDDLMAGDIVVQLHTLKLPANLPSDVYRFEMGAYTRDDLKRLPLNVGTDHVWLQIWQPPTR